MSLVVLEDVTLFFADRMIFDAAGLRIGRHDRIGLVGPNGSGKTTLIRVLLGLYAAEGELLIDGHPLTDRRALAARLAYVPQLAPQMAASVDEVVAAIGALRGVTRDAVAAIALDLGLDLGQVGRRSLRALSGGMRQKLLLALALAARPELLVLDEPTASLDAAARARFFEHVGRIGADATVILCSHRLDELRALIDHVVVLAEGRVVHDGGADRYLADRMVTVVELRYRGGDPGWLGRRGFVAGASGWWSKVVSPAEKPGLVLAALAELGADVDDLAIRDSDRLELAEVRHDA